MRASEGKQMEAARTTTLDDSAVGVLDVEVEDEGASPSPSLKQQQPTTPASK